VTSATRELHTRNEFGLRTVCAWSAGQPITQLILCELILGACNMPLVKAFEWADLRPELRCSLLSRIAPGIDLAGQGSEKGVEY
jgi:hypothetical protein